MDPAVGPPTVSDILLKLYRPGNQKRGTSMHTLSPSRRLLFSLAGITLLAVAILVALVGAGSAHSSMTSSSGYLPIVSGGIPPTPTPSPTPFPAPPVPLTILPGYKLSRIPDSPVLMLSGEVQNDTPQIARYISVYINFYDASGRHLASPVDRVRLLALPSGDRTCFAAFFTEPPGWAHFTFQTSHMPSTAALPALTLTSHHGGYDPQSQSYVVTGEIRNDDSSTVHLVLPVLTLYDADGSVAGCSAPSRLDNVTLRPGETHSFRMIFATSQMPLEVADYRLQLFGEYVQ
jgi:hypothetical protein